MKAYIFAFRFYNYEKERPNLGGTQTYITELSEVLHSQGYEVHILDEKKGYHNNPKSGTMGHRTKRFFQWSGKMGERL